MKTKTLKAAVSATIANVSFADEIIKDAQGVEASQDKVNEGRKGIMARIAAQYGVAMIQPASKGGFNGQVAKGADGIAKEASRLNVPQSAIKELQAIVRGINNIRHNVWQEYQRAYFGRDSKPATVKDEPEMVKALKAEIATYERSAIECRAAAKVQDAQAMLADNDGDKEESRRKAKKFRELAADAEAAIRTRKAQIKEIAESNAGADAYGALHEALRKLGERYKEHKDVEVSELAKQVLALLD